MACSEWRKEHLRKLSEARITTKEYQGTSEYMIWVAMRQRCNNPRQRQYKDYGGRGIKICERWNNFFSFLADMGKRPDGLTLDRIDNDKGYCPENCRWTDRTTQRLNSRQLCMVSYQGKTQCATEWARELGLNDCLVSSRLRAGMTPEQAITWKKNTKRKGRQGQHARQLTYQGKTQSARQWAMELGLKQATIYRRLTMGWSVERTLTTAVLGRYLRN